MHKVVGNDDVFLIRRHLDIMWTDGWLIIVRVVQALWVVEIGYVQSGDVVRSSDGCFHILVSELSIEVDSDCLP